MTDRPFAVSCVVALLLAALPLQSVAQSPAGGSLQIPVVQGIPGASGGAAVAPGTLVQPGSIGGGTVTIQSPAVPQPVPPSTSIAPQPGPALLRLDRPSYAAGRDCVAVRVEDADQNRRATQVERLVATVVYLSPAGPADSEHVALVETGVSTGVFRSSTCLPTIYAPSGKPASAGSVPNDGVLTVSSDGFLRGMYVDPDNPQPSSGLVSRPAAFMRQFDASFDVARVFTPLQPALPGVAVVSGAVPGGGAVATGARTQTPISVAVPDRGFPVVFARDEVIYQPVSREDLREFLARYDGRVLAVNTLSRRQKRSRAALARAAVAGPAQSPTLYLPPQSYLRIRVDLGAFKGDLTELTARVGITGRTRVSSSDASRLLALVLEEQLSGERVMLNPLAWSMSGRPTGTPGEAVDSWMDDPHVNLGEAIALFRDAFVPGSVRVAFLDSGFASPGDFAAPGRAGAVPATLDYGDVFSELDRALCTEAGCVPGGDLASAAPPLLCAAGTPTDPACLWHGTLAFGVAGATAGNGFGSAGVAGHSSETCDVGASCPQGSPGLMRPFLIGTEAPFLLTLAAAIRHATDSGVHAINISAGLACRPFGIGQPDLCEQTPQVTSSWQHECSINDLRYESWKPIASWPGFEDLPIPRDVLQGRYNCDALRHVYHRAGNAGLGPLTAALQYAQEASTPVIASGPQLVVLPGHEGEAFPPLGVDDIGFVPCVLDGVICVGAMSGHETKHDPESFGVPESAIDIWAPWNPMSTVTPGGPAAEFQGTSAAAAFISGTVALIRAIAPALQPCQIAKLLRDTAFELDGVAHSGGVDVLGALQAAVSGTSALGACSVP